MIGPWAKTAAYPWSMPIPTSRPTPAAKAVELTARWADYLDGFHAHHAGVHDQVLRQSLSAGGQTPYEWLARAVAAPASRVVDIGCGSGAMTDELAQPGRLVVGVDLSREELLMAARRCPGPWIRGDALHLPIADSACDAAVTVMGLAVIRPLARLLSEVTRVLRPGGVFAALMPTTRPLQRSDLAVAAQITRILRATPRFPGTLELRLDALFLAHGLRRVETARERYRFTVRSHEDASALMQAMYLPMTDPARVQRAIDWLAAEAAEKGSVEVPIPMRRIVVIK